MKSKLISGLGILAALTLGGCAKVTPAGLNDNAKSYLDAWVKVHYPKAESTSLGSYIISDTPGSGKLVGDEKNSPYVYVTYSIAGLDGSYSSYTSEVIAQQLGTYDETEYYGAQIWDRQDGGLYAGLDEVLSTMKVGGSRTVVIPGWLHTYDRYDKAKDYMDNVSGTDAIYTISVEQAIDDIVKWEADSLAAYVKRHYPGLDSTSFGFYYKQLVPPTDTTSFKSDKEVYFNYTGKLLNGQAFDTTIQDTAKVHNIYSAGRTYEPTYLNWKDESEDLTMGSSSSEIIKGFEMGARMMRKGEKGVCLFLSGLGYKYSGNGNSIPGYSPLIFEFECIGAEDDDEDEE